MKPHHVFSNHAPSQIDSAPSLIDSAPLACKIEIDLIKEAARIIFGSGRSAYGFLVQTTKQQQQQQQQDGRRGNDEFINTNDVYDRH